MQCSHFIYILFSKAISFLKTVRTILQITLLLKSFVGDDEEYYYNSCMHKDYNIAFGTQSKIHIWIFMCTNKVVSQCKTIVTNAFLLSEYQNSEKE